MTFKLPEPIAWGCSSNLIRLRTGDSLTIDVDAEESLGRTIPLYTHAQLIQALKDWGEECAAGFTVAYTNAQPHHYRFAIREKAKELK